MKKYINNIIKFIRHIFKLVFEWVKEKYKNTKIFVRRRYLFWKYKRNKNSGKLLIQKKSDRKIGLTNMMVKDCIKNGYYLYVPTSLDKRFIIYETENEVNLLCPSDNLIGERNINIVIDNHCSFEDVRRLLNEYGNRVNIVNGFVYEPMAK